MGIKPSEISALIKEQIKNYKFDNAELKKRYKALKK